MSLPRAKRNVALDTRRRPPFTKAVKGRDIDVLVSSLLGSAPTGLALNSPIQPRAALRFALGYHLAPRWGKKPHIGNRTANHRSPVPLGQKTLLGTVRR